MYALRRRSHQQQMVLWFTNGNLNPPSCLFPLSQPNPLLVVTQVQAKLQTHACVRFHGVRPCGHNKTLGERSFPATWLGYGPSTAVIHYWNNKTDAYGRCHHGQIDDYTYQAKDCPAQTLLDSYATNVIKPLPTPSAMYKEVGLPLLPLNLHCYYSPL